MEYNFSDRAKNLTGNAIREIFKVLSDKEMISFAGGLPASVCLPAKKIKDFACECLEENPVRILQYGETEGYLPLRKAFLKYLENTGIENQEVDNTLIISGGQQGIDLMFKAFLNKGDVVLVQNPTYLAALHIAKTYEVKPVGFACGEDGVDLADFEEKIKTYRPKIAYIVPNFSNPTGMTLKIETRKEIVRLAEKYNVVIIEDDPYRQLRFSGEHLPAIKSFDKSGAVVYLTSTSKTVAPALRIGVAVGAKEVIRRLTICKQAVDVHTSTLSQAIVEKFISSGELDIGVEKSLPLYKEKCEAMLAALDKYMPDSFKHTVPQGGLFIWGRFTDGTSCKAKFREAVENKVAYVSGNDFFADGSGDNYMRLNFSNATLEQIETGVKRLAAIFTRR